MVAPTQRPQSRGIKCDVCSDILKQATWLDQSKLAQCIDQPFNVIKLIDKHDKSKCPCMPQDIKLLLVGSTHFEIHRLSIKALDYKVYTSQLLFTHDLYKKKEILRHKQTSINDIRELEVSKLLNYNPNPKDHEELKLYTNTIEHLKLSIDFWCKSFDEDCRPFNSKLAIRLCISHHVIYACYLFKYNRLLVYQLKSAILLVNLFKTIDGVTQQAQLHADFLLITTLNEVDHKSLAKNILRKSIQSKVYCDKSFYESILLNCAWAELNITDETVAEQLQRLSVPQKDDKLQHYLARAISLFTLIKHSHIQKKKIHGHCYKFLKTLKLIIALIRRCYECSFQMILAIKNESHGGQNSTTKANTLDSHVWMKYAIASFVFSSFDFLAEFYIRCGLPENLELFYNCLALIPYRVYNFYWISRISVIGSSLDDLCSKHKDSRDKLDTLKWILPRIKNLGLEDKEDHLYIKDIIKIYFRLTRKDGSMYRQETVCEKEFSSIICDLVQCDRNIVKKLNEIEYYDYLERSRKLMKEYPQASSRSYTLANDISRQLGFKLFKAFIVFLSASLEDKKLVIATKIQFFKELLKIDTVESTNYNQLHDILELLLHTIRITASQRFLIKAIETNDDIIHLPNELNSLENDFSKIKLCKQKEEYNLANLPNIIQCLKSFSSLTKEDILFAYLEYSFPNPDYLFYRRVNELISAIKIERNKIDDSLVYHLTESISSNSLRYRWMVMNENRNDTSNLNHLSSVCQALTFESVHTLVNSFIKVIPSNVRVLQLKYIYDEEYSDDEHILALVIESGSEPYLLHVKRDIKEFEIDLTKNANDQKKSFPAKINDKITEIKNVLSSTCLKSIRDDSKMNLESELGLIINETESWFGPFKTLFHGKIIDENHYVSEFVKLVCNEIVTNLQGKQCKSFAAFEHMIEQAPHLDREEFCHGIASLFSSANHDPKVRQCFSIWQKNIENFFSLKCIKLEKKTFLNRLNKQDIALILNKELELMPWENMQSNRYARQGIFRVPSLRFYYALLLRFNHQVPREVNSSSVSYVLDPENNLAKTNERFEKRLRGLKDWKGICGKTPQARDLELWLSSRDIYLFIGHGAGTSYYNTICNNRGLTSLESLKSLSIVMGCSSGRMTAEGSLLETYGVGWAFVLRGAPAYVGLLWDVTDTDIDRFLDKLLDVWLLSKEESAESNNGYHLKMLATENSNVKAKTLKQLKICEDKNRKLLLTSLTTSIAEAKLNCQHRYLVGSTPVCYGLPVVSVRKS